MKFNAARPLIDLDGRPITTDGKPDSPVSMMAHPCIAALKMATDEGLTINDHVTRYKLLLRLTQAEGEIELSAEEVAVIKAALEPMPFSSVITGQVALYLESAAAEDTKKGPAK